MRAAWSAIAASALLLVYEPATNTWTMLLGPSAAPASYGPG
jgi:hypothetical protein